jgi:hypothetical protein
MLCPKCGKDSGLEAWLDKVRAVKARKKWFWSYCPNCNAPYELEINRGNVILGDVDGFPGPAFIPHKTCKMPGLSVQWEEGRVHVAHEGRRWTFKTI